jgi:hypothetical protein
VAAVMAPANLLMSAQTKRSSIRRDVVVYQLSIP